MFATERDGRARARGIPTGRPPSSAADRAGNSVDGFMRTSGPTDGK